MSNYDRIMEVLEENFLGASIDNVTDDDIIDTLHENGLECTLFWNEYSPEFNQRYVNIKEVVGSIVFSFKDGKCVEIY